MKIQTVTGTARDLDFDYSLGRVPWMRGGITESSAPRPNNFTWGKVRQVHTVGEYSIVEYDPRRSANVKPKDFDPSPNFHAFIGTEDTHHSYSSLDAALAGCIATKHDGINTKADRYFMRAIRATDTEER